MKKNNQKLFIILLFISLIINLKQCSDSQSHGDDIKSLEYEVMELESEIININKEKNKKQEIEKPIVKKLKNKWPIAKVPEPVDSIDSIPNIQVIDSLKKT